MRQRGKERDSGERNWQMLEKKPKGPSQLLAQHCFWIKPEWKYEEISVSSHSPLTRFYISTTHYNSKSTCLPQHFTQHLLFYHAIEVLAWWTVLKIFNSQKWANLVQGASMKIHFFQGNREQILMPFLLCSSFTHCAFCIKSATGQQERTSQTVQICTFPTQ